MYMKRTGRSREVEITGADKLPFHDTRTDDSTALRAAMIWLCQAQDAAVGGGLSYGFCLRRGWLLPYPETTGYCIPTFLEYSRLTGDDTFRVRAERMASWTLNVQSESGGIPGGIFDGMRCKPPMSFDTGQVLQGWCTLYRINQRDQLIGAAIRAGDWLLEHQTQEGAWEDTSPGRREPTRFAFNSRTSWSLLELFHITHCERFRLGALRNLEWTLSLQLENGWFRSAGFGPQELPLTHTVAYIVEGLLRCWEHTSD